MTVTPTDPRSVDDPERIELFRAAAKAVLGAGHPDIEEIVGRWVSQVSEYGYIRTPMTHVFCPPLTSRIGDTATTRQLIEGAWDDLRRGMLAIQKRGAAS